MADQAAWARAGDALRELDPKRFAAILRVVEDICEIHRDPLTPHVASGHFVMTAPAGDDLD